MPGYPAIRGYGIGYGPQTLVALLKAYFDDSGETTDPEAWAVAVGGCVASVEAWEAFSLQWDRVLVDFKVPILPGDAKPWFHAVDFAHSENAFKGWDKDEPKRRRFLAALQSILRKHVRRYVGCTAPLAALQRPQADNPEEPYPDDPYYVCLLRAIQMAARTADLESLPPRERVHMSVADKPRFNGLARHYVDLALEMSPMAHRIGPLTTGESPQNLPPLQAADWVAYELTLYDRRREPRYPYLWFRRQRHEFGRSHPPKMFEGWIHWEGHDWDVEPADGEDDA